MNTNDYQRRSYISNDRIGNRVGVRTAALKIGVSVETIRRWIKRGKLPAAYVGQKLAIRTADIVQLEQESGGVS